MEPTDIREKRRFRLLNLIIKAFAGYNDVCSQEAFWTLGIRIFGGKVLNLAEKGILINQPLIDSLEMNPIWSGEIEYAQNFAETLFLFLRISKVNNSGNDYYIGNVTNLTAYKQIEKDIHYLKYFDHLTKLNNKAFLDESGMELISGDSGNAGNHALILINIDNFRIINEAKGFDFGNKVLIALANRLKTLVSEQDVLARLLVDFANAQRLDHSDGLHRNDDLLELARGMQALRWFARRQNPIQC